MLDNEIKTETRTNIKDSKDSIYLKYLNELKNNKNLLEVGIEN